MCWSLRGVAELIIALPPLIYAADEPGLGCPVEYINLKGTSYEKPAVCKYTGNKYYSDDWRRFGVKE